MSTCPVLAFNHYQYTLLIEDIILIPYLAVKVTLVSHQTSGEWQGTKWPCYIETSVYYVDRTSV